MRLQLFTFGWLWARRGAAGQGYRTRLTQGLASAPGLPSKAISRDPVRWRHGGWHHQRSAQPCSENVMSWMQSGVVSSLLRRAFATRQPLLSTSSSFSPICSITTFPDGPPPSSGMHRCCSGRQHLPHQQRAGLSTLRRGLTGPLSARLRLPMRGLEEFRDPEVYKVGDVPIVGRPWTVPELRKKSFEDLHKLWFVLYKEKNMLMSQVVLSRRSKVPIPAGDRRQKVKRSMKAIRVVVGERQRAKRAVIRERQLAAKREAREAARAAAEADGEYVPSEQGSQAATTG